MYLNPSFDYQSFLEYNVPETVNWNDSVAANQWLSENFEFNNDTEYWFTLSGICNDLNDTNQYFADFVSAHCQPVCDWEWRTNNVGLSQGDILCAPRVYGDGKCDYGCNMVGCNYDAGDCLQLCL